MDNSPPSATCTPADVRHPERGLSARCAVDQGNVPLYVDRVGQVTARAGRKVADVDVPLPETTGRPVQTPADGVPALFICSPSPENRHVIRMRPQLLVGASVAVDEPLESLTTLTAELIPARHPPSPSPLVTRLRTHSAPKLTLTGGRVGVSLGPRPVDVTRLVCPGGGRRILGGQSPWNVTTGSGRAVAARPAGHAAIRSPAVTVRGLMPGVLWQRAVRAPAALADFGRD